jgi:hypothetical protein
MDILFSKSIYEKTLLIEKKEVSSNENLIMKKKKLIEISENLTKIEYLEIFNIFVEDKCQYSENINGVFINLNNISEITIDKIFSFINFIKDKKEDLLIHEEKINNAKDIIKENNEKNIEFLNNDKNNNHNNYNYENDDLSSDDDEDKKINYLNLSSDEDDNIENKITLKKKRIKHTGKKAKIIITTDHGTVHVKEPSKIVGDRNVNSNLRYKQGKSLDYNKKDVFEIKNPADAFLPKNNVSTAYVFAKEDKYFVYPNNYNHFVNYYGQTFQHGGISLEEILIPYVVLKAK